MPDQGNETSKISARVRSAEKNAMNDIAWERSTKTDKTTVSDLYREAQELYLAVQKAKGDIPEDARDDVEHIDVDEVLEEHGVVVTESKNSREVEA